MFIISAILVYQFFPYAQSKISSKTITQFLPSGIFLSLLLKVTAIQLHCKKIMIIFLVAATFN